MRVRCLVSPFIIMTEFPKYKVPKIVAKLPPDVSALKHADRIVRNLRQQRKDREYTNLRIVLYEFLRLYSRPYSKKKWQRKSERIISGELSRPIYREIQHLPKKLQGKIWDSIHEAEFEFLKEFWPEEYRISMRIKQDRAAGRQIPRKKIN